MGSLSQNSVTLTVKNVQIELPVLQFELAASFPVARQHRKQPGTLLLIPSPKIFVHINKILSHSSPGGAGSVLSASPHSSPLIIFVTLHSACCLTLKWHNELWFQVLMQNSKESMLSFFSMTLHDISLKWEDMLSAASDTSIMHTLLSFSRTRVYLFCLKKWLRCCNIWTKYISTGRFRFHSLSSQALPLRKWRSDFRMFLLLISKEPQYLLHCFCFHWVSFLCWVRSRMSNFFSSVQPFLLVKVLDLWILLEFRCVQTWTRAFLSTDRSLYLAVQNTSRVNAVI